MKRILWAGAALWLALPGCAHTYGPEHLPMLRQQAQGCRDFGNESEARRIEAAIAVIEAGGTGHLPPSGVVPRVEVDSWQRREAAERNRRMIDGILGGLGGRRRSGALAERHTEAIEDLRDIEIRRERQERLDRINEGKP